MIRQILLSALAIASLGLSAQAAELAAWSPQPEDHPTTQALQGFLTQAREVGVEGAHLMPVSAVADQNKLIKGLQSGEIGVAVLTSSTVARLAPQAKVLQLPFLFRNARQMFTQLDGDIGKELEATMAAKGVIVLGWYDGGTRSFYLRNRPARSVAELKGLKMRVPDRTDLRNVVSSLGGEPLVMPYQNVNAALDAGDIDGAENDLLSYEAAQHYKHARYFVQSNHCIQFETLVISAAVWNHLDDATRKGLLDAGHASAQNDREVWTKRVAAARTRLEKDGVTFIDQRDNAVFFPRVAASYKPYMDNPATSGLLLRLMTAHS